MFHTILIKKWEHLSFSLTGGSWSNTATVITERPENAFKGTIKNIYSNLESISVHKSLDAIET